MNYGIIEKQNLNGDLSNPARIVLLWHEYGIKRDSVTRAQMK